MLLLRHYHVCVLTNGLDPEPSCLKWMALVWLSLVMVLATASLHFRKCVIIYSKIICCLKCCYESHDIFRNHHLI
jgi:hypothetical protein